jgi:hypothetical protein
MFQATQIPPRQMGKQTARITHTSSYYDRPRRCVVDAQGNVNNTSCLSVVNIDLMILMDK